MSFLVSACSFPAFDDLNGSVGRISDEATFVGSRALLGMPQAAPPSQKTFLFRHIFLLCLRIQRFPRIAVRRTHLVIKVPDCRENGAQMGHFPTPTFPPIRMAIIARLTRRRSRSLPASGRYTDGPIPGQHLAFNSGSSPHQKSAGIVTELPYRMAAPPQPTVCSGNPRLRAPKDRPKTSGSAERSTAARHGG